MVHSIMSAETHILHSLYFDFAFEAAHTTTNYLLAAILSTDIVFTAFSQLLHVSPIRSCFNLARELNSASIWRAGYIRGCELVESIAATFSLYRCFDHAEKRSYVSLLALMYP